MLQQAGKLMLLFGAILAAVGGLLVALGKAGLGKLPGDLDFGGKNWRVYLPIGTCLVLSILLTLAMWVLARLRR